MTNNYEEKYKQALERAKEKRDEYKRLDGEESFVPSDIEYIFPELRESEDEQHRKWILEYLYDGLRKSDEQFEDQFKSAIAWLEKQGEKKDTVTPQWMVDFLKDHRRHFATPMGYDEKKETDGKLLAVIKWLEGNPQLEQKPSWSEEDESMLTRCIGILGKCYMGELPTKVEEELDWLKSLKPQKHWKPSEEQMDAVKYFIDFHRPQANASIEGWSEFEHLESLYNDLKKL